MSETLNINEIIGLVKETNKDFEMDIYVPSLNKEVHFKPMNASHLKTIIKTSVEGVFANNYFNQSVYSIIKDICDSSIPLSKITTLDKIFILLQLRKKNVKNSISIEFKNEDKTVTEEVNLEEFLKNIKKKKLSFSDEVYKNESYEITLGFPSIEQEFSFDRYFEQNKIKKTDQNDRSALKELFAPLFINEISQYIKIIKIKEHEINFLALPISERNAIVESLPGTIVSGIIENIDKNFGKQISKIISLEKEINGEVYKGQIELNANIFA
jgi:hypothetical protein